MVTVMQMESWFPTCSYKNDVLVYLIWTYVWICWKMHLLHIYMIVYNAGVVVQHALAFVNLICLDALQLLGVTNKCKC